MVGFTEKSDSIVSLKMPADRHQHNSDLKEKFCLSTAYLAPVSYYQILANAEEILLEQHENYSKQSYRNRCVIATANGLMELSIPIEKPSKSSNSIKDIRISYHTDWQANHWKSILSAYNSSPFLEYYIDDLVPFYEQKWCFLWDFNQDFQQKILELIDLEPNIKLTSNYQKTYPADWQDFREILHPKKQLPTANFHPYYQVFSQKYGFQPNLSILDLLLNMGNETILHL